MWSWENRFYVQRNTCTKTSNALVLGKAAVFWLDFGGTKSTDYCTNWGLIRTQDCWCGDNDDAN